MKNRLKIWLNKVLLIILFILAVASFRGAYRQYRIWKNQSEYLFSREEYLLGEKEKNKRLAEKLVDAEKPEFIEQQAYEKLGLVKIGSDFLQRMNKIEPIIDLELKQETKEQIPNWKKWWDIFF